ncbi:CNOT2 [Acanthosepion pharaonis]|uniref:CNOT2 n=1 Tax=Acanthosepion pharaonis TaxID=158019 RepID=A0A812DRQ4_ACAPH|nr:CNOT2 [Sepia pharaonis]
MAFRNPLDGMAGMGQRFGADQFSWNAQYPLGRKGGTGELSPGGRKNPGMIGMQQQQPQQQQQPAPVQQQQQQQQQPQQQQSQVQQQQPSKARKGFFEDDDETNMYMNPSIFRPEKEVLTSQSPSQLTPFTGNFYNQVKYANTMPLSNPNTEWMTQNGWPDLTSTPMPPRSLGSQFPRSNQGHVTPTSMNPNFSISLQPLQQASPSRNLISTMGHRNILGPTQANQTLPGIQKRSSLSSVLGNSSNPITSISSSFGLSQTRAGENSQPSLDLSEFPILGNRTVPSTPAPSARSYVGMVNKPVQEQTPEFQIQQEDFPALPGSQNPPTTANDYSRKTPTSSVSGTYEQAVSKDGKFQVEKTSSSKPNRGIQTHHDGTVSNIPPGMVTDQFGIVGLLTFIRAAENDPNLVALAPGIDLTTLGLNMNSPENLYSTFQSPWADSPCRPQDIDFHVPCEYLTNIYIRDKLPFHAFLQLSPVKLNRYGEDLLFFLFYMNGGDVLQLAAAAELYNRDWRFHKEERVWITRAPGLEPIVKTINYERGTYYYFDATNWRKVAKEFHLEYDKLEDKPLTPTSPHISNQQIIAH